MTSFSHSRDRQRAKFRASNLLDFEVASLVVKHVAPCVEFLGALRTLERIVIVVDAQVNLQVLLLCEAFVASGEFAAERVRVVVHVQVGAQADRARERFRTARVRAFQVLLCK